MVGGCQKKRRPSFEPHWPKGTRCSSPIGTSGDIFRCVIPQYEWMIVRTSVQGIDGVGAGDWALAEWFASLWQAFRYTSKVHIRRVHYQIVSQNPPVVMPNGLPYENTEGCWNLLNLASKAARYLQLVDPEAFVDRRNPEAVVYASSRLWGSQLRLPDFPDLPAYRVSGYEPVQAFHLECWCEKSTMNDVLG